MTRRQLFATLGAAFGTKKTEKIKLVAYRFRPLEAFSYYDSAYWQRRVLRQTDYRIPIEYTFVSKSGELTTFAPEGKA
jgi:hypothetical protein